MIGLISTWNVPGFSRQAATWVWPQETWDTMFNVVNTYTRAAQKNGLPAESSYRLQKVGGEVLGMLS